MSNIEFSDFKETIRIKNNSIRIGAFVVSGKDGDFFIVASPSILVSGYGDTLEEAEESYKLNIELFARAILDAPVELRNKELKKLGFEQIKFQTKNYSKLYVDENGILQGLDLEDKKIQKMEMAM